MVVINNSYLDRYTEIERENRILLEKMSNIMQSTKPNLYNPRMLHKIYIHSKQTNYSILIKQCKYNSY